MQNQSMHFVLSTDAKPRLKWTPELHQRFIDAINQLGGADSKYKTNSILTSLFLILLSLLHFRAYISWCIIQIVYVNVAEATPKSIMRVMEIPGLTLYHLKSHLQVFLFSNDIIIFWLFFIFKLLCFFWL